MSMIFTIANADIKSFYKSIEDGKDPLTYNRYKKALKIAEEKVKYVLNPNDIICSVITFGDNNFTLRNVNFTLIQ